MADRVSASITIGGTIDQATYSELALCIADEDLSTEWDGPAFEPGDRQDGEPLRLFAHEVAWGRFETLESFCTEQRIAFARCSDGYSSQWGCERVVHRGDGMLHSYTVDGDDVVMIDRQTVERLGTLTAIMAYFDDADAAIPPLIVTG